MKIPLEPSSVALRRQALGRQQLKLDRELKTIRAEYVAEVRVKGGAVETVMLDLHDFKCVSDNATPKDWKQVDQLAVCAKYEIRSRKPGVKPKVIAANPWQGPKPVFKRLEWQLKD